MDIKKVIKAHGYTLTQVAALMGVTRVTLCQTITGNPTINTLYRIADVIGCDVAEFFSEQHKTNKITCPHCGRSIAVHLSAGD